ncbi:amino acid deaminase [Yersinia pekkanenii]|uniref:D-threonine aldolase n=1 Tax=Yersinia pekkanenii TaxID=1288385 RepID=A0A0T9NM82_9GAMM|nr:amino acid deaminase [Yersinia pekkanenii]CNH20048.1 D-threonine aldolase [Yersinia pekkanenii]CRY66032.1 D-threonine aldolase [Yersinia pekkanenii]
MHVDKKLTINAEHKAAAMFSSSEGKINILNEDTCLPAVVIKTQALDNNIRWMQQYANQSHVSLAPHGKTTMTPAIFRRQLEGGAWGIGVGTAYQAKVALDAGVSNIIIANQLVGKSNIKLISELLKQSSATIYCCVDHQDNAIQLSDFFAAQNQKMQVLLELGIPGGRCGCRTEQEAYQLAALIKTLPGLTLSGIEFYEGIIHSNDLPADIAVIETFIQKVITITRRLFNENSFDNTSDVLLTGAGSVWYDIVCRQMQQAALPDNFRYIIRPGCYITHDRGVYAEAQQSLRQREPLACELGGDLISALELVAYIQSLPEPHLAIVNFGKRDAAFDSGLPQPIAHYRNGQSIPFKSASMRTENLMDQHAMVKYDTDLDLKVGDILIFGTSHPCITFDKWKTLYLVDDNYDVIEEINTFF